MSQNYYVYPQDTVTNTAINNALEQESVTSECFQRKVKGGTSINVWECPGNIVETLFRNKKKMSLKFKVYRLQDDELVPADTEHLEATPVEPVTQAKKIGGGTAY